MQQDLRQRQQEVTGSTSIDGSVPGVAGVVDADANLVRALAGVGSAFSIRLGEVVQTAPADSPDEYHSNQGLAEGPTNSQPTLHDPPMADDESIPYTTRTPKANIRYAAGEEPLILGGEGSNAPAVVRAHGFTLGSTRPGEVLTRAAA